MDVITIITLEFKLYSLELPLSNQLENERNSAILLHRERLTKVDRIYELYAIFVTSSDFLYSIEKTLRKILSLQGTSKD